MTLVPFVAKNLTCDGRQTCRSDSNAPLRCRGAVYSHSVIADFAKLFLKAVDQARPTGVRDNSKPAVAGGAKRDIASRCIRRSPHKATP